MIAGHVVAAVARNPGVVLASVSHSVGELQLIRPW